MKKRLWPGAFLVLISLLCINGIVRAEEEQYQDKKSAIEVLVNEAAELIQTKGQAGIDMIKDKDGKFNTQDTYVFVTSAETGADLVNPAFEEVEGLPAEDYTDLDTQEAQMTIVNAVKYKDTAWVEYLWPKPQETKPVKKIAYLKKIIVNGKARIVGAGFYPQ